MQVSNTTLSKPYSAPALSRGLRILEVLVEAGYPRTQQEIAGALGHTVSEIFRLLSVLEREGYLHRDTAGRYAPTLRLFRLGARVDPVAELCRAALGPMRDFSEATGQECHLGQLHDGCLVVLASEDSGRAVTLRIRKGSVHDPRRTASGRLLLAHLDGPECLRQCRRAEAHFSASKPDPRKLDKELAAIRKTARSTALDESLKGVRDDAVLVRDPHSGLVAALACTFFASTLSKAELARHIRKLDQTAAAIATNLVSCIILFFALKML